MIAQIPRIAEVRPPAARVIKELVKVDFLADDAERAFAFLVTDVDGCNALNRKALERLARDLVEPDRVLDVVENVRRDLGLFFIVRLARKGFRVRPGLLLDAAQEVHLPLDAVHRDNRLAAPHQDLLFALVPLRVVVVVIPVAVAVRQLACLVVRILGLAHPFLIRRNVLACELTVHRVRPAVFLGLRLARNHTRHESPSGALAR